MKNIEVVAAIITKSNGRILCTQRNEGPYSYISKKYEFSGGKMEQEGPLNVFYETNLIFDESNKKSKEELFEFCDMKYAEGFKIKTFNTGDFQSSDFKNYLCILEKKG